MDHPSPTITTGELAQRLEAELIGPADVPVTGVNSLQAAGAGDITFVGTQRHAAQWPESQAVAVIVSRGIELPDQGANRRSILIVDDADLALAGALDFFASEPPPPDPGIHPSAIIHPTAKVDPTASVGAHVVIGPRSRIGPRAVIEPNAVIGEMCQIGADCVIRNGVVIRERCVLGERVSVHPNAVIGGDGFGYRPDGRGGMVKLPHIGTVEIHDDVEIGAGATIDRAKYGATVLEAHVKLDNLVQIGHNVRVGRGSVIASQVGIAGSSVIGPYCRLAGQAGIADHIRIGERAQVAAKSGVFRDVPAEEMVGGAPAVNLKVFWRVQTAVHKLPSLLKVLARHGIRPTSSEGSQKRS